MNSIYISNILEGNYRSYQSLPTKKRIYWTRYDLMDANRVLLYRGDHKVIITSFPINKSHFDFFTKLMGWKNIVNLYPEHSSNSICEDLLSNKNLNQNLKEIIKTNPKIQIIPYRTTPEFNKLAASLKQEGLKFTTPESVDPDKAFGLNYAHSKRGFRHLWSKSNREESIVKIPQGFITANKEEAAEAGFWFKQQEKDFVIKYNKGTQGVGILLNKQKDFSPEKQEFKKQLKNLMTDKIWHEPVIIVEELITPNNSYLGGSPSIELLITEKNGIKKSYASQQLLAEDKKTFLGVYIHPEIIKDKLIQAAFKDSLNFGRQLAELGYHGYFDVDLVISKDKQIYAVESNLRRTGGTHVHEAAQSLLGEKYEYQYHVMGKDVFLSEKNKNLDYQEIKKRLKNQLIKNKKQKEGILITNPDMLNVNVLSFIITAKTKEKLFQLEKILKKKLQEL